MDAKSLQKTTNCLVANLHLVHVNIPRCDVFLRCHSCLLFSDILAQVDTKRWKVHKQNVGKSPAMLKNNQSLAFTSDVVCVKVNIVR